MLAVAFWAGREFRSLEEWDNQDRQSNWMIWTNKVDDQAGQEPRTDRTIGQETKVRTLETRGQDNQDRMRDRGRLVGQGQKGRLDRFLGAFRANSWLTTIKN